MCLYAFLTKEVIMLRRSFLVLSGIACVECAASEPVKALSLEIHSYEDAMKLAKDLSSHVYVLFTSGRCVWCEKQKSVMVDPKVVDGLKSFVVVYADVSENKELTKRHGVRMVPTHLIVDEDGDPIKKFSGYQSADDFLKWLD